MTRLAIFFLALISCTVFASIISGPTTNSNTGFGAGTKDVTVTESSGRVGLDVNLLNPSAAASSVSVSNFPAVQVVSASMLPLPTGATTEATLSGLSAKIPSLLSSAPGSDSGQSAIPVRVISQLGAGGASSGLTDTQLRASPVPVSLTSTTISNFPAVQSVSFTTPLSVTGNFYQATQPISGSVSVSNFPASQTVTGSVSVSNFPATQPVSGTLTCNAGTGTLAVSGPLTDTQLRASAVPVSLASTTITNFPATQAVSGTVGVSNAFALDATLTGGSQKTKVVDASGAVLTSTLNAAKQSLDVNVSNTVPVSGTFWQTTQPVSIATMPTTPVTGTFWQATQPVSIATMPTTPVTGPLTDTQLRASAVPVSLASTTISNITSVSYASTNPVPVTESGAWTASITTQAAASNNPIGVVSIGNSLGKTNTMKTGSLATSATTADQVVLTYTVTTGKTFYLEYVDFASRLTTFAATATNFGNCSLESPTGTKLYTQMLAGSGITSPVFEHFSEPVPIASATVIRIVCTPAAVTAMTWQGNFGGYEK